MTARGASPQVLDADLVRLADDYGVLQTWCRGAKML